MCSEVYANSYVLPLIEEAISNISALNEGSKLDILCLCASDLTKKFADNMVKLYRSFAYKTVDITNTFTADIYEKNKDKLNVNAYSKVKVNYKTAYIRDISTRGKFLLRSINPVIISMIKTADEVKSISYVLDQVISESSKLTNIERCTKFLIPAKKEPVYINKKMWQDLKINPSFYDELLRYSKKSVHIPDSLMAMIEIPEISKYKYGLRNLIVGYNTCYLITDSIFKSIMFAITSAFNLFKKALDVSLQSINKN